MLEAQRSTTMNPDTHVQTPADVVASGHCIGCAFCTIAIKNGRSAASKMVFDLDRDHFVPVTSKTGAAFVCPGREMDMPALSLSVHGREPEDTILGITRSMRVAYSRDETVRSNAASGGVVPTLVSMLFEDGDIDAVYCTTAGAGPYDSHGKVFRRGEPLRKTQGSIYHPTNFAESLGLLLESRKRFAFVGLPCQVAALEQLKRVRSEIAEHHAMSIGLFCGGINTFKGIAHYLKGFSVDWQDVEAIEYRHGGWPGVIRLVTKSGAIREIPRIRGNTRMKILRYVIAFQGYWMLQRCRMCPDQINDFADIAVGDPHLARLRARGGEGFSVVLGRTERGEQLLNRALTQNKLVEESISREEVVDSQGYTLDNRRHVYAYKVMGEALGMKYPDIVTYAGLDNSVNIQNKIFAFVDLIKIKLPKNRIIVFMYLPWQIFEYIFLTFAPRLILKRIGKLLMNR